MAKKTEQKKIDLTEEELSRLKTAFENGGTDDEACAYAEVDIDFFRTYEQANPSYAKLKKNIRHKLNLRAKSILIAAMNVDKEGDVGMAIKYLDILRDISDRKVTKRTNQKWKWKD